MAPYLIQNSILEDRYDMATTTDTAARFTWRESMKNSEDDLTKCCLHEIIDKQAQISPNSVAVDAWDGTLTYSELARLSSGLAAHLGTLGVQHQDYILVVFEKCRLAIVVITAILKSGCICVPLDPSNAGKRLSTVLEDTQARFAVTSSTYSNIFSTVANINTVVATTKLVHKLESLSTPEGYTSNARPDDAALLMYSSGSTGRPKGIVQQHGPLCFSIYHHSWAMGIRINSRTLQFSAYTFDTSMSDIFGTFMQGAVLCVCSDWGRLNDLAKSIKSPNANYVCLTPTVAEQLEPEDVPSLRTLSVGGEALTVTLVDRWAAKVRLINVYGITECLVWTFTTEPIKPGHFSRSIGRPACGRAWVTAADDPHQLLEVGNIGELLIEGPNLAREYLNDPKKTAKTFIDPPQWLQNLYPSNKSLRRLYRTGDLVRQMEDGTIEFLGRRDTQVKLNGQRVELGEIEYHMKRSLPTNTQAAAHVIRISPQSRTVLVGSICLGTDYSLSKIRNGSNSNENGTSKKDPPATETRNANFEAIVHELRLALARLLPALLVPVFFIPIQQMPLTVSGKLDRRVLQEMVAQYISLNPFSMSNSSESQARIPPSTETEKQLASMWSTILGVELHMISVDHQFVRLGGDSARAMKLVALARKNWINLTVADILQYQQLSDMAKIAKPIVSDIPNSCPPFSLLKNPAEVIQIATRQFGLMEALIQDAYPCTPLQQGLLALSLRRSGAYVARTIINLPSTVTYSLYMKAWEQVYRKFDILRTRIIETNEGLIQVVIDEDLAWDYATNDDQYLLDGLTSPMGIASQLNRFAFIQCEGKEHAKIVWTAHHCTYDGWSAPIILREVNRIVSGQPITLHTEFNHFIKYLSENNSEQTELYWKEQFQELEAPTFPIRANYSREQGTILSTKKRITLSPRESFTSSSLVRAALALLISKYSNSDDIVFGTISSGRNAQIEGIETIVGPTFSTVPVRIQIDQDRSVSDMLEQVQKQALEMIPHETLGLQNIRQLNHDAEVACDFQCLLITQPPEEEVEVDGIQVTYDEFSDAGTYPLIIDCKFEKGTAVFQVFYDSSVLDNVWIERFLLQLDHVIQQFCDVPLKQNIKDLKLLAPADQILISKWNATYPNSIDRRVCDVIQEKCRISPGKQAICSWDGNFTYEELDKLSTALGNELRYEGIVPEIIVPIVFERSKWVVVALLAVNKVGGAFVLLNPTHPLDRLQSVVAQTNSQVILSSREFWKLSQKLSSNTLVVEDFLSGTRKPRQTTEQVQRSSSNDSIQHQYKPSDLLYAVFTSGTSGTPKGIMIENRSFCTYIDALAKMTNAKATWRGLVSSAYSFDSSLEEILMPLMLGGTICMPSQHELSNDLTGAMNRMGVHWGVFTPSLARLIDPRQLTTLTDLYIGGEQMTDAIVESYGSCVRLTNTYGPSECCPTGCVSSTPELYGGHIGRGVACRTWIVDPNDHERLMPVGCIGELILDGPNVGRGYLNDDVKSRAAFINSPTWLDLVDPAENYSSLNQYPHRMYKTGDLVRYCSNGTMEYIGRKDQQIKLYGQRIELSEIEHHIQSCVLQPVEVIVEVASRSTESDQQILVAFIVFQNDASSEEASESSFQNDPRILSLRQDLVERVPRYMIPSLYLRLSKLPLTSSDKIDRRKLKQLVFDLSDDEFLAASGTNTQKRIPETELQSGLQNLWSEVLKISKDHIGLDDKFFQMGGDSIRAIRLATSARKKGWSLTVADITRYSTLEDMAQRITRLETVPHAPSAFSLLAGENDKSNLMAEATKSCGVNETEIEDIYPCSHLQEGIMALSLKFPNSYVATDLFEIPNNLDVDRLSNACRSLVGQNSILRTRIIHTQGGFYQVIIKDDFEWSVRNATTSDFSGNQPNEMVLGKSLCRFTLIEGSKRMLSWTIHHSLYDGWSISLLQRQLNNILLGQPPVPTVPYSLFIRHVMEIPEQGSSDFWRRSFAGATPVHFPKVPRPDYLPHPNKVLKRTLDIRQEDASDLGISNAICASWAIVVSRYTECEHVSFGVTTSGRKANLPSIEAITGPTFATVPAVVRLDLAETKKILLHQIHQQSVDQTDYEQFGLENIRNLSSEARDACEFQTLLVIQPVEFEEGEEDNLTLRDISPEQADISAHPLTLECQLTTTGFITKASFDTEVISEFNMSHIISQFFQVMRQLCSLNDCRIKEMSTTSPEDVAQIASWNHKLPQSVNICVHDLILVKSILTPSASAICSWDGDLTYAQLEEYSRLIGLDLQEQGVGCGDIIPLLFEKSIWSVVSMLAVLRTGAIGVFLDRANHPFARMQKICEEVKAKVILCGPTHYGLASSLVSRAISISSSSLDTVVHNQNEPLQSSVTPQDPAFIIFTSGSTGTPKGIVHEHQSLSSSYVAIGPALKLSSASRVYQFSSFTFDMCIIETLTTLIAGGTVCIPSDEERLDDVEGSFARFKSNWAFFTPSFARHLNSAKMPGLKTLCLGGEAISQRDVEIWAPHVEELMTISGPAETSLCTAGILGHHPAPYIGNMIGGLSWITEVSDHTKLAPIGVIGELLVEGPVVARGYINLPERTSEAFIEIPDWLSNESTKPLRRMYRSGDLVRYNSDGSMQIFGRRDGQVKIRGQRVELEEVEHQVNKALDVKLGTSKVYECAVDAFTPADDHDTTYLAIFFANKVESPTYTLKELTSFVIERLQGQLPPYMVPSVLLPLPEIPLTATKKANRKRLRSIASKMSKNQLAQYMDTKKKELVPPSSEVEEVIHRLWSRILRVDIGNISSDDKFIQLGGDSLRAVAFVSAARDEGLQVTVADIFRQPRLRDLAAVIQKAKKLTIDTQSTVAVHSTTPCSMNSELFDVIRQEVPQLSMANCIDLRPCTPSQRFMLAAHNLGFEVFQPRMSFKARLTDGRIEAGRLIQAWKQTVEKHSILRTIFVESPNTSQNWYQLVLNKHHPEVKYLADYDTPYELVKDLLQTSRKHLPGCQLLIRDNGKDKISCTLHMHHALMDGGCIDELFEEIARFYSESPSPSPGPQYRDFQSHLETRSTQVSSEFWDSYLDGMKPCLVPTHCVDSELSEFCSLNIPIPNIDGLRKLCVEQGTTLSILMQVAWASTLRRCTGNVDVTFGNIISNRDIELPGVEKIIGPVFGVLVRRLRVTESQPTLDILRQSHDDWINCIAHRGLSYLEYYEQQYGHTYNQQFFNTVINHRRFARLSPVNKTTRSPRLVLDDISTVDPYAFDVLLGIDDDDEEDNVPISAQLDYWGSRISNEQASKLVTIFVSVLESMLK